MSILEAAQVSRLAALRATRDALASAMDACGPGVLPQISKQFRDTLIEIDELDPPERVEKETGLSDFEKRLRERESRTKGSRRTKVG